MNITMFLSQLNEQNKFDEFLTENKQYLVVVFFTATWSDECKHMKHYFSELANDKKMSNSLKVLEVEAEEYEEISMKYGIEAVPSFLFLKDHHILHLTSGADVAQLNKKINELIHVTQVRNVQNTGTKNTDINSRLAKLIHSAPVMLFMKGTPQEVRCGFSKKAVELLQSKNVRFGSFDILSDDDVCEGLTVYSNWPTYPQLYINGELIGGYDILKELIETGEFDSMIPKKEDIVDRIKRLINQHKIMLFMKGNIREPKCGFSRQIVEILNETGENYDSFDILGDEEVRQGLKEYSKWPTYPQLYVQGELVGGLDIVTELKDEGELLNTLRGN